MTTKLVHRIIRRSNLNQLLIALGVLIAVVIAVGLAQNFYLFNGPFALSKPELLGTTSLNGLAKYYVTIEGDAVLNTGFQKRATNYGTSSRDVSYMALTPDNRLLLVQVPGDPVLLQASGALESTQYTGALVSIPSDMQREVLDEIIDESPEFKGRFLPFMMNAGDFSTWGYFTPIAAGVIVFICLWTIVRAIRRMGDYSKHPIMRGLGRFGDAETVADMIEVEMQQDHEVVGQNAHLTRNWLVYPTAFSLEATRLNDVMWIYKHVTQQQRNFIPTKKTYATLIWDRYGVSIKIPGKEEFTNATLHALARRNPGAFVGYQKEIDAAWYNDRDRFVTDVDKRRQEIITQQR